MKSRMCKSLQLPLSLTTMALLAGNGCHSPGLSWHPGLILGGRVYGEALVKTQAFQQPRSYDAHVYIALRDPPKGSLVVASEMFEIESFSWIRSDLVGWPEQGGLLVVEAKVGSQFPPKAVVLVNGKPFEATVDADAEWPGIAYANVWMTPQEAQRLINNDPPQPNVEWQSFRVDSPKLDVRPDTVLAVCGHHPKGGWLMFAAVQNDNGGRK